MKKQFIYKMMLLLLVAHFLVYGCGTKTKSKSETETETKAKETAEIEKEKQTETKRLDSIRLVLKEELKKEFSQKFSETTSEDNTRTTTTEVTETIKNPVADFRQVGNTDLFLNDKNGQVLERKTKTIIEERFKKEQQKEIETKKLEEEKRIKDSISTNKYIDSTVEKIVNKHILQYESKHNSKGKDVVQEGWRLGFWGWFWIILILLIIIAMYVFRKWIGRIFPYLQFIKYFR